ncbi:zinc-finger domain-containing protein [Neobacillus muris]|uniref:zinc-finger domain-containing protein n=1 Tax=Neobacillus muris TaxID=2941334 RepID=UPI00203E5B0C|nr:zinc-finger domain-containing protein [Neobacillus muris]
MNYPERKELLHQVESLMLQYCDGCFLHRHLKKESGRRAAHRFCITQCTIGEKIKQCGEKLS